MFLKCLRSGLRKYSTVILIAAGFAAFGFDGNAGRSGGLWDKIGPNQLNKLPVGRLSAAGQTFDIADGDKSCAVLGTLKGLPGSVSVALNAGQSGDSLYLLHGAIFKKRSAFGDLVLNYADGTSQNIALSSRTGIRNFLNPGPLNDNAARALTWYADDTQVSLFVSKYPLRGKVKTVEFKCTAADAAWIIAGITVAPDRRLEALPADFRVKKEHNFPEKPPREAVAKLDTKGVPRNIIMLIGDGMGFGAVKLTSLYNYGKPGELIMESLPHHGMAETYSADHPVTDSAAAGTALACGFKTKNGRIGMSPEKRPLRSIAEAARDSGRSVGILTTDALCGATPAAYSAHVPIRSEKEKIALQQSKMNFDVMIGQDFGHRMYLPRNTPGSLRTDDGDPLAEFKRRGAVEVSGNAGDIRLPDSKKVYGAATFRTAAPAEAAALARAMFERLAANPKGFFAMVECSWPDAGGHSNSPDTSIAGVNTLDWILREAMLFAQKHPGTLIVVSADHETGSVTAVNHAANHRDPIAHYGTIAHTFVPVPIFAVGPGAENFDAIINNSDIPRIFARLWNVDLTPDKK